MGLGIYVFYKHLREGERIGRAIKTAITALYAPGCLTVLYVATHFLSGKVVVKGPMIFSGQMSVRGNVRITGNIHLIDGDAGLFSGAKPVALLSPTKSGGGAYILLRDANSGAMVTLPQDEKH